MATLLYQGHGSFRICTARGTVVYVDPYAGEGYDLPADLILVSHQHHDHNALDKVTQKAGCQVLQNFDLMQNGVYGSAQVADVHVEAFAAENRNHPRSECIGFLICVDGKTLYASGDTSEVPEMATLKARQLDYALLCSDGVYNMSIEEAAHCANIIQAKVSIPIHMKPGALFDAAVAARFDVAQRRLLQPGEEMQL